MKVSDYITSFLIEHGITDAFGYPGGMLTYLLDSLSRQKDKIRAHVNYHEQGAAFAACGYAQISSKLGVAYATSGPGATNLITGIGNAYFDSIPVLFITGQVNTYESRGALPIRQKGFQETDIVPLVSGITKYCAQVLDAKDIRYHMEKAYYFALEGRPGPVLLDIPMNVQRAEIEPCTLRNFEASINRGHCDVSYVQDRLYKALSQSKRPCVLVGAGVQTSGMGQQFAEWIGQTQIPVVSSMLAVDILAGSPYYYGFIGAYGLRHANFILNKSDLIFSLGSRLDLRQIGVATERFAVNARLLRVDIDDKELARKIKNDEEDFLIDLKEILPILHADKTFSNFDFSAWHRVCEEIKSKLEFMDEQEANVSVRMLSEYISPDTLVTTDVGQNQVWVAQSFIPKGQRILFTGGHGAMGYSLPAAIGAHYGSGGKKVFSFCGDGGLQMNIQELQFIVREHLPIKIILLNNYSLGMIRHFQEMYFGSNFVHTKRQSGYTIPDFGAISRAYGIPYFESDGITDIDSIKPYLDNDRPAFIEISLKEDTYVFPKLSMGKLNQDQDPELDRDLFEYISNL